METIVAKYMLEKNMNTVGTLYRIKRHWIIHFVIGNSLQEYNLRYWTNYPRDEKPFARDSFRQLSLEYPEHRDKKKMMFANTFGAYFRIKAMISGTFEFYITDSDDKNSNKVNPLGSGYFIVDPIFVNPLNDKVYDLDSVNVQTYLTKNLGPLSEWYDRLRVARECAYSMIHFTPLQQLGYSRSAYSIRDHFQLNDGMKASWEELENLLLRLQKEWGILLMTDLVYNHVASNSEWILAHSECAYNLTNSLHLRPAFLLDRMVWQLTMDIENDLYVDEGIKTCLINEQQVDWLCKKLWRMIHDSKLYEFFLCDLETEVARFQACEDVAMETPELGDSVQLQLIYGTYKRLGATVDLDLFKRLFSNEIEFSRHLRKLNEVAKQTFYHHMEAAVRNFRSNCNYRFLDKNGLRLQEVNHDSPLMWTYFYLSDNSTPFNECEQLMDCPESSSRIMAYNGWVMSDDPLKNFAESGSNVYLRRELIVWGDSVKLRYGNNRDDCPELWDHMERYTEQTAHLFHAIRLDNCHSTPLHVTQHFLDCARRVRPNIYVVAELFTGSENVDNVFINKLGINSLIREAQAVHSSPELGGLIFRFGAKPIGSFMQTNVRPLVSSRAHALLYDLTHDNESPIQRRTVMDVLPTAALVCATGCAVGSTRGYDELVPHQIDVVKEERKYLSWSSMNDQNQIQITSSTGIIQVKTVLNRLHNRLVEENYTEQYVDQVDHDVIAVTRHCPSSRDSIITICRNAFTMPSSENSVGRIYHLNVPGYMEHVILEASVELKFQCNLLDGFVKHSTFINGISQSMLSIYCKTGSFPCADSRMVKVDSDAECDGHKVVLNNFLPGSVVVLKARMFPLAEKALRKIEKYLSLELNQKVRSTSRGELLVTTATVREGKLHADKQESMGVDKDKCNDVTTRNSSSSCPRPDKIRDLLYNMNPLEMNLLLYRCEVEDKVNLHDWGLYKVDGAGTFVFCGLQGVMNWLNIIRPNNDVGHALCHNIRSGDWLMDYITNRMKRYDGNVKLLGMRLTKIFGYVKQLPRYLIPCYFDSIMYAMYQLCRRCINAFCDDSMIVYMSEFSILLRCCSVQFCGAVSNCRHPPLAIDLFNGINALPTWLRDWPYGSISIAAGFPHFSEGIFRTWGRDSLIALRGLLLLNKRFEESRAILLSFASVIRHGNCPNLFGNWSTENNSIKPRYNSRDAIWWWLYAVQQYCREIGHAQILSDPVAWLFPEDVEMRADSDPDFAQHTCNLSSTQLPLISLIYDVLLRQLMGVKYREWNAGSDLDKHMTDEGFNVEMGIDPVTGFPFGGNSKNCGTWMDKMGSSGKAGNRGIPATPRDGSAVELVGLCAAVVKWLAELYENNVISEEGLQLDNNSPPHLLTWKAWYETICRHFHSAFYIGSSSAENGEFNLGIYRDTVHKSPCYTDYHCRPNFLISMTVCSDLFETTSAWNALQIVKTKLLGPLGMKTLSEDDYQYRGTYDNSNDSDDYTVAQGYNYHQGPEWLWLSGYYLRATLIFARRMHAESPDASRLNGAILHVRGVLARHAELIEKSPWKSLPELTNRNGAFCFHSCESQAWSVACIAEAFDELNQFDCV